MRDYYQLREKPSTPEYIMASIPVPSNTIWHCTLVPRAIADESKRVNKKAYRASLKGETIAVKPPNPRLNSVRHPFSLRGDFAKWGNYNPVQIASMLFKDFGIRVGFKKSEMPGHVALMVPPGHYYQAKNIVEDMYGRSF